VHAGLKALASLRMEKGYRDYGHDIDNTDDPLMAGFNFAIDWDHDFVGRDALQPKRGVTPTSRLVSVLCLDPEPLMYHAEIVRRDGVEVGYVRAASYGHTLGGAVGLAMVTGDVSTGSWTVEINGAEYPATVSLRPFYDPKNERIKA
jgi:4-methylaminobutanoate oxidase (formaldehyde-forming)